ncbi:hypothetical protein HPB47_026522 [Ixodes persulcatus]|uniref:Uncharacterized protein n=1 Tax=Ixodes persulcatus TaxID=34615 RepID=A0AC60PZ39_IXOPE|nr:hypothetical protein HPB47_026522 [Ixodes persulcatus]
MAPSGFFQLISGLALTNVQATASLTSRLTSIYTYDDSKLCTGIASLVESEGYPFERHDVVTQDGYVIEMHRIPRGRESCPEPCHREPVFAMTGLAADSATFVFNLPRLSLGFVLADNKCDVWLGNSRGNAYGKRHKKFDPKSRRFWDFTFHEHAVYDVPAQIDYVLNATKRNNLIYVKAFAGLTPFNKLAHMKVPPLALFAPHAEPLLQAASFLGHHEVLPRGLRILPWTRRFCAYLTRGICTFFGDRLVNLGSNYVNETRLPLYLCYAPSGTSMKNIIHLDQMVKSKKPQKFDYGVEMNRVLYGQRRPPLYNLSNVKTDVGVFWSEGDEFVAPQDVRDLVRDLGPRVKKNYYIDDVQYTHAHFIVGTVNSAYLNKDLLEFLGRYRAP